MREIKFRAWDNDSNKWFTEWASPLRGNWTEDGQKEFSLTSSDGSVTLEQYTGLKDKHSKEIYEGDIVKVLDGNGKDYLTNTGIDSVVFLEKHGLWYVGGELNNSLFDINLEMYIEVIGNIHETPELLSDKH